MSGNTKSAIMTAGGTFFDPLSPLAVDVNPVTIDHALNRIVRFNGHTRRSITVAEHSLRVSRIVKRLGGPRLAQLLGLLHDAAEAYVGDIVRPVKTDGMRKIEDGVLAVILEAVSGLLEIGPLNLELESWTYVREADEIALFFEAMLEQPGAEVWAPGLLAIPHKLGEDTLSNVWRFLPDIAPRPGESWLGELYRLGAKVPDVCPTCDGTGTIFEYGGPFSCSCEAGA